MNIIDYMFGSYVIAFCFCLMANTTRKKPKLFADKNSMKMGVLIGFLNAASYYIIMKALTTGPASIIFTLMGLNLIIVIGLAMIFYKEKMTVKRMIAILLAIVSIVLLT